MAATEKKQMWYWAGDRPEERNYPIAASQGIFMPGAPCYISTSGTVTLVGTTANANQALHGHIVGLANASSAWPIAAELDANTVVKVALAKANTIYAMYVENNGTDLAAAQTHVGDELGLTVSSTATQIGYTTADVNKTTNTVVRVVDIASNVEGSLFTTSDNPGVVLVKVRQANIDSVITA